MSDFRNDPNFVRDEMRDYDSRVQWAAVVKLRCVLPLAQVVGASSDSC